MAKLYVSPLEAALVTARGFLDQAIAAYKDGQAGGATGGDVMLSHVMAQLNNAITARGMLDQQIRSASIMQQGMTGPQDWDDPMV
jgi:hypothetical protein